MLTGSWRDTLTGRWHGTGSKLTGDGPGDAVGGESGSHYHRMEVNLGVMEAHTRSTLGLHTLELWEAYLTLTRIALVKCTRSNGKRSCED